MFQQLHSQIIMGLMILVCGLALWRGRTPHRLLAVAMTLNWLLSGLVQNRHDWAQPQWAELALDAILAVVATGLAVRWNGLWLLASAAFAWLVVMTHLAMAVDRRLHARAYLAALALWSVSQMLALAWGVWIAWRERRAAAAAGATASG